MQETFYRLTFKLNSPLYERREEMLSKIEQLKGDLKARGHSGRYGLNHLLCYSSFISQATCIVSTFHPEGRPWFDNELGRLMENEENRRKTLDNNIDEHIKKFNRSRDKAKFIEALSEKDLQRFGMSYEDDIPVFKEVPDEYVNRLEELKKQPLNYASFAIMDVFIEPVKPSKKELDMEKVYLEHLEQMPTEKEKYVDFLEKKTKHTPQIMQNKKP